MRILKQLNVNSLTQTYTGAEFGPSSMYIKHAYRLYSHRLDSHRLLLYRWLQASNTSLQQLFTMAAHTLSLLTDSRVDICLY